MAIFLLVCNKEMAKETFDLDGSSSLRISSTGFANGNISMGI